MDTNELLEEFNLAYNNLSSNQAPGLDKYEIAVYMTKSQNIIEDSLYNEFEHSEEARKKLSNLLITIKLYPVNGIDSHKLFPGDIMFELPNDVRRIVNEKIMMDSTADNCIKNKFVSVQPCLHDEVDRTIENPFKFNNNRALRLDTSVNGVKFSEIISKDTHVKYYEIRYLKNLKPIILEDLAPLGLSIDGETAVSQASLTPELHRNIVELAAKLAYEDYKR